jgi:hypothetical protein
MDRKPNEVLISRELMQQLLREGLPRTYRVERGPSPASRRDRDELDMNLRQRLFNLYYGLRRSQCGKTHGLAWWSLRPRQSRPAKTPTPEKRPF